MKHMSSTRRKLLQLNTPKKDTSDPTENKSGRTEGTTYVITGDRPWNHINYQDTTTRTLEIEVAGGKCNKILGKSHVKISFNYPTCKWEKSVTLDGWYTRLAVPAHLLRVEFVQVEGHPQILGYFSDPSIKKNKVYVDLGKMKEPSKIKKAEETADAKVEATPNVANGADATPATAPETAEYHKVRFEYHPRPTLKVSFTGNKRPANCTNSVVLPHFQPSNTEISVSEDFGENVGICNWIEGKFHISNKLGETPAVVATMDKSQYTQEEMNKLKVCNPYCERTILHAKPQGNVIKSSVVLALTTGSPNPAIDANNKTQSYAKPFVASFAVPHWGVISSEHWAVITGPTKPEATIPVSFPEYWPLMVLHDPPGGNSFVSYKNAKLTVDMQMRHLKYSEDKIVKLGLYNLIKPESTLCAGLGSMVCNDAAEGDTWIGGMNDKNFAKYGEYETDQGGGFQLSISMSTSAKPAQAGMMSDMYLIPALTIVFTKSIVVGFDDTACLGTGKMLWSWSLKGESNRNTFSWLSHWDLLNTQIPSMEKSLAAEILKLKDLKKPDLLKEANEKIGKLQQGLAGWKKVVNQTEKTYEMAKTGKLEKVSAYRTGFYSGLAPEQLINHAQDIDAPFVAPARPPAGKEKLSYSNTDAGSTQTANSKNADAKPSTKEDRDAAQAKSEQKAEAKGQTQKKHDAKPRSQRNTAPKSKASSSSKSGIVAFAKHALKGFKVPDDHDLYNEVFGEPTDPEEKEDNPLGGISSILFTGGGAKFQYQISEYNTGKIKTFEDDSSAADISMDGDMAFEVFGIGIKIAAGFTYDYSLADKITPSHSRKNSTAVTFTLSDPDVGDSFLIDVYEDRNYNSFVFHTVSGMSKCPAEKGTSPRELPKLTLLPGGPSSALPNKPIIYNIKIGNQPEHGSFELYLVAKTNRYGLKVSIDGANLARGIVYDGMKDQVGLSLEVERGPGRFAFPDLTIGFRSKCEGSRTSTVNLKQITFLQPCSDVKFAAPLADTRFFKITHAEKGQSLKVSVMNPNHSTRPWSADERLDHVWLEYRPKGTYEWFPCHDDKDQKVDFMAIKGFFGYHTASWKTGMVADGVYEIRAHTSCSLKVPGAKVAPGMLSSQTSVIPGVMDTKLPQVFQTSPAKGASFLPGSVIRVVFNEQIVCSKPFPFLVSLKVGTYNTYTRDSPDVLIKCDQDTIEFTLQRYLDYNKWVGQQVSLEISHVKDLIGNVLKNPVKMAFGVFKIDTKKAGVLVEKLFLQKAANRNDFNRAQVLAELGSAAKLPDASRIQLHSIYHHANGATVSFTVNPSSETLQATADTPLAVVNKLHAALYPSDINGVSLLSTDTANYPYLSGATKSTVGTFLTTLKPSEVDKAAYLQETQGKTGTAVPTSWSYDQNQFIVIVVLLVLILLQPVTKSLWGRFKSPTSNTEGC